MGQNKILQAHQLLKSLNLVENLDGIDSLISDVSKIDICSLDNFSLSSDNIELREKSKECIKEKCFDETV